MPHLMAAMLCFATQFNAINFQLPAFVCSSLPSLRSLVLKEYTMVLCPGISMLFILCTLAFFISKFIRTAGTSPTTFVVVFSCFIADAEYGYYCCCWFDYNRFCCYCMLERQLWFVGFSKVLYCKEFLKFEFSCKLRPYSVKLKKNGTHFYKLIYF